MGVQQLSISFSHRLKAGFCMFLAYKEYTVIRNKDGYVFGKSSREL